MPLFLLVSTVSTGHFSFIVILLGFFVCFVILVWVFFYACGNEIEVKQSNPLPYSPSTALTPFPFVSPGVLCVT